MTRREWLHKNPPPRAAKHVRELLESLVQESNARTQLETNKAAYSGHIGYWTQQAQTARQTADANSLTHANSQLTDIQNKIAEIDKQLAATANLQARIAQLKAELSTAARCPVHSTDLVRHKNRPDDLFLCEIGPHFFLWTQEGATAKLAPVDLAKSLPGIDEQMGWI